MRRILLLVMLFALPLQAANVTGIEGDTLTISRDGKADWSEGQELCVYRANKKVGCGELTKLGKKTARLTMENWDMEPRVGDSVRTRDREPASVTEGETQGQPEGRDKHELGFYLSLIGDPYPTIIGVNAAYNVLPFLRVNAGYGSISFDATSGGAGGNATITTIGGGVKALVPGWKVSPSVGMNFASVSVDGTISSSGIGSDFTQSASHFYMSFALDYQASSGFHWSAGWNQSLKSGVSGLPYMSLGYFFDVI